MDETLEFSKGCCWMYGHRHHAGATIADIFAAGTARIFHVHLSDCPKLPADQVRDNQRVFLPGAQEDRLPRWGQSEANRPGKARGSGWRPPSP